MVMVVLVLCCCVCICCCVRLGCRCIGVLMICVNLSGGIWFCVLSRRLLIMICRMLLSCCSCCG